MIRKTITGFLLGIIFSMAFNVVVYAFDAFVINNIEVQGLSRVSKGTVLDYLHVKTGDKITVNDTSLIIKHLYETGFFENIKLHRRGQTLIIDVQERPIVSSIHFSGNKIIPTKKLQEALKGIGLEAGEVFRRRILEEVRLALLHQYYSHGNYNVRVNTQVKKESRNRVDITINISEGRVARIEKIKIIGNNAFSDKRLAMQLQVSKPHIWSVLTHSDQYSKEKLTASLEALRAFYMNHGYIRFRIDSSEVTITPDKKSIYIVIHITEGAQYHISGYKLVGNLILPRKQLRDLIDLQPGDVFSQQKITKATTAVTQALGEQGYAFAKITPITKIDDKTHKVFLIIQINPNKRVYVHRIDFSGNLKTKDVVLRRQMRQIEGSQFNLKQIQESERRLRQLPYLKNIKSDIKPVPGTMDQVDVVYNVTERPSAELSAGVGYSSEGFVFNAGVNQPNFLGTGNILNFKFSGDPFSKAFSVNYINPFYTPDGISRSLSLYVVRTTPGKVNITNYNTNIYGFMISYGIPISEYTTLQLGYGYTQTHLSIGSSPPVEIEDFVCRNGTVFREIRLLAGLSYNDLDQFIFPNHGLEASATAEVNAPGGKDALGYYKLHAFAKYFYPLFRQYAFSVRGEVGYGSGFYGSSKLPFYENYFAGGIDTVRGFKTNTLGPRDTPTDGSTPDPIGGNLLLDGSLDFYFPTFYHDNIRMSVFVDAGNVFNTYSGQGRDGKFSLGRIRYSAGIGVEWRSPMGPLVFSISTPLGDYHRDKEIFQFTIASTL